MHGLAFKGPLRLMTLAFLLMNCLSLFYLVEAEHASDHGILAIRWCMLYSQKSCTTLGLWHARAVPARAVPNAGHQLGLYQPGLYPSLNTSYGCTTMYVNLGYVT